MAKIPKTLQTIVIEQVKPELDGGRYPVKRIVGETFEVTADVFKEGHDTIAAKLRYKIYYEKTWQETPMHYVDNDRDGQVHFHCQQTLVMSSLSEPTSKRMKHGKLNLRKSMACFQI